MSIVSKSRQLECCEQLVLLDTDAYYAENRPSMMITLPRLCTCSVEHTITCLNIGQGGPVYIYPAGTNRIDGPINSDMLHGHGDSAIFRRHDDNTWCASKGVKNLSFAQDESTPKRQKGSGQC